MTETDFRQFIYNTGVISAGIAYYITENNLIEARRLAGEINNACRSIQDFFMSKDGLARLVQDYKTLAEKVKK